MVSCLLFQNFILSPDKWHGWSFLLKLLTGVFILFRNIREGEKRQMFSGNKHQKKISTKKKNDSNAKTVKMKCWCLTSSEFCAMRGFKILWFYLTSPTDNFHPFSACFLVINYGMKAFQNTDVQSHLNNNYPFMASCYRIFCPFAFPKSDRSLLRSGKHFFVVPKRKWRPHSSDLHRIRQLLYSTGRVSKAQHI